MAEMDPERLARLLDGRLSETERTEMLRELEADPELRSVLADAAAVLSEGIEPETNAAGRNSQASGTDIVADPSGRSRNGRWMPWALAAGVAALVAVPLLRRTADAPPPPTGWNGTPWPALRGLGDALPLESRGVRLGARLEDLARTRDSAAFSAIRDDLLALVVDLPGAAPAEVALRAATPGATAEAERAVAALAPREAISLGRLLEANRLRLSLAEAKESTAATQEALALLARLGETPPAPLPLSELRVLLDSALARVAR